MSQRHKNYTNEQIVAELLEMDSRIIHGGDFFKQCAELINTLTERNAQLVASEQSIRNECNSLRRNNGSLTRQVAALEGRIANALA